MNKYYVDNDNYFTYLFKTEFLDISINLLFRKYEFLMNKIINGIFLKFAKSSSLKYDFLLAFKFVFFKRQILNFNDYYGKSFLNFMLMNLKWELFNSVKKFLTNDYHFSNRISFLEDYEDYYLNEIFNQSRSLVSKESLTVFYDREKFTRILTKKEFSIWDLKFQKNFKNKEIISRFPYFTLQQIDNASSRIKTKLKFFLKKNNFYFAYV